MTKWCRARYLAHLLDCAQVIETVPGRFAPCVWRQEQHCRGWKMLCDSSGTREEAEAALSQLRQRWENELAVAA